MRSCRKLRTTPPPCLLTDFLKERLDFEVCIGWGAGGDVVQAQKKRR
jgi:hypothetical protein